jgi:type IV secretory pathway TraG/TraD family ATPase VirD4
LLKSIIIFLSNSHPSYCSLPHAILLGLVGDQEKLLLALERDEEASLYASPIFDAFAHSPEQFAGVMANFKILLGPLVDNTLFWVLSGDEVPLVVNDPLNPLVVCLGNTPSEKACITPILSMITSLLMGSMYGHGRNKSFLVIDELPTLIMPGLVEVPATARKYHLSTVVAFQNTAQLERAYGRLEAKEIRETFSNHFVGRGPFSSSKDISDMMGKKSAEATSTTKARSEVSKTIHKKEDPITRAQEGMQLQPGEFMGNVVHPRFL